MNENNHYFSKPFIVTLIISTIIIFISLLYGGSRGNSVTFQQANQTLAEVDLLRKTITWQDIFFNNLEISLLSFIPLIGTVFMMFVQYNTGFTIGMLAKATGYDYIMYLSLILTSPVGFLEYIAYVLITGESLTLIYSLYIGKDVLKERLTRHSWKTLLIIIGLLFVASIIEALMLGRL
jgi:uncharacterized membrane protein SpoIIM required for sporulation